jgi:aminoglycoside/choline kinase family phosphotransferase
MAERGPLIAEFLARSGWGGGARRPLAGDASFRRYERVERGGVKAVLMDAPPDREDVRPFVFVARHLKGLGYSAPEVLAADEEAGLLLLEDLGDDSYSRLLDGNGGGDETLLYQAAVDLLADLHRASAPPGIPPYDDALLLEEAELLTDWYMPARHGAPTPPRVKAEYRALWLSLFASARGGPEVMVLRDYHADNLIWLPGRGGLARVGILDFQDAVRGPAAYDLVSLLEDARREVPAPFAEAMIQRYLAATGVEPEPFRAAYAILGAQRNAKIVGIFTRLWKRDGKPAYLDLIPRVWGLLERDLEHPALAPMKAWLERHVPPRARRRRLPGAPP